MPGQEAHIADFVVLGAGLAGLSFAREVSRRGATVTLLEQRAAVGGLARTLTFDGYRFDIGGHRMLSTWPHVVEWARQVLDDELIEVPRISHICLNGRYISYPLQLPDSLFALGLVKGAGILASYLNAARRRPVNDRDSTFETWVMSRFGRALYDIYFRPYTEKIWGVKCTELAADHAVQRIRIPSLFAAIKSTLLGPGPSRKDRETRFQYPPRGFGVLTDRLADQATATGLVSIEMNSAITRLDEPGESGEWKVHYVKEGEACCAAGRHVISTIPVTSVLALLPAASPSVRRAAGELDYRGLICVFLALEGPRLRRDTWTYFPGPEQTFGRTHEPVNWSPAMVPEGKTSLVAEIFCSPQSALWSASDDELRERTIADLARLKWLTRDRVRDAWLLRERHAYPIYRLGYRDRMQAVQDYLTRWPSLHLVGRTGSFQYLNADAVIKQTLELVDRLVDGRDAVRPVCGASAQA